MDKLPVDLQYLGDDKMREGDLQTRKLLSDTLFQVKLLINFNSSLAWFTTTID